MLVSPSSESKTDSFFKTRSRTNFRTLSVFLAILSGYQNPDPHVLAEKKSYMKMIFFHVSAIYKYE